MRWSIAMLAILVGAALDASFGAVLAVGPVRGHLLPGLVVFIAFSAPRKLVLRAAMAAGLLVDLLAPAIGDHAEVVVVPGPHVLGFALGAAAMLPLRGLLSKHSPFSPAAATGVFSLLAGLAFVAVWQARLVLLDAPPPWSGSGTAETWQRVLGAFGDGVVAMPLHWILARSRPLWGFVSTTKVVPGVARAG